jgi:16S rRNA (uracil1498-N3)-methyltransferase
VLRLNSGDEVELFDDSGATARGVVKRCDSSGVIVQVDRTSKRNTSEIEITVASAIPKGERADWLVEKLSELGVARFIPLQTARSVVLPQGKSKRDRWMRLAIESAKQSRRPGVMQIDGLTPLDQLLASIDPHKAWLLATEDVGAVPITDAIKSISSSVTLLVGPEGGWTEHELATMRQLSLTPVRLTTTILRVETAAIVAAGIIAALSAPAASA